jgi:hypothetical protein
MAIGRDKPPRLTTGANANYFAVAQGFVPS